MHFSQDFVEEVRARNDIVEVIGSYVRLERKGANHFGLCPFHNEKSPSFSVHQGRQIFHCFGCGEGGNVFTFMMKYENMSFVEAVRALAERAGIAVPDEGDSEDGRKSRGKREELLAINKEAAIFYWGQLQGESGGRGLAYFTERGLSKDTMRRFGLGFADVGGSLMAHLRQKGFSDAAIIEAGLAANDEKRGLYAKFWNRVMFPIFDIRNRVLGFGGRVMGDGKPKYLNSPETPIFEKGRNLYGLNYAKNAKAGHLILCEGYMDVIAMHQAGFTQAVASLGTAFTQDQAHMIKRYVEEVVLCYDSDEAGVKAARRAIGILREEGLRGRVLKLSPHKDPDEFIKAEGGEAFGLRVKKAESVYFFELSAMERSYDMQDPDGRTRFIKEAAKRLGEFAEPIERENYIVATASRYGVALEDLRRLVSQLAVIDMTRKPKAVRVSPKTKEQDGEKRREPDRMLLTWLSDEPDLLPLVERYIAPGDFEEGLYRQVAEGVFAGIREGKLNPGRMVGQFSEEDQPKVAAIFDTPMSGVETKPQREKAMESLIRDIKTRSIKRAMEARNPADAGYFAKVVEDRKSMEALKAIRITL